MYGQVPNLPCQFNVILGDGFEPSPTIFLFRQVCNTCQTVS